MKLELIPDITDDGSDAIHQTADQAGFSKDGLYSWVYKDSVLEIFYAKTNEIFADWRFGKALKDKNTIISCVTEFDCSEGRMLLVATESLSDEGTLCLFSFSKKRVIRAIEFPRKIRATEIVFTNAKEDVPSWILSKHLHFFCGLAAVGTDGGFTYLVDLCLDDVMLNSTTEINVKKLTVYSPGLIDPKTKRETVCSNDRHMAVLIDNQCHRNEQFYYRRQDDSIDKVFEEDAVCVTSLKYLSQAGILAVGFNFGCFQLWRLHTPVLDYSSRFIPDSNAVSSFVVQEPENDPRNLVYLWVGRDRSVMGEEHGHGKLSTISLYQLCFNKKDTFPDFGLFYEDLESVCSRLDHNLHLNPYFGGYNKTTWSSQIICAYTITNPVYTPPTTVANDSFEEGCHGNDLSLSVFVWKADSKQSGHNTSYWMAIFDLNRWYHAQMPHVIRCLGSLQQVCPYWAVYKLDDIVALSYPQSLLHVQLTGNNVLKFSCKSFLPPEEHSYPSALEITDVRFITPEKTIKGHCYGWQGQLLQELARGGAIHLVTPDNFYHQCLQARLIPQNFSDSSTVEYQRKALLNLSLDYNLTVCLINKCVQAWMDGEFVDAGCSLALLLDWAWQAVARTKEKLDSTCQILYDCSGRSLDPYTDWLIRRHSCSVSALKQVFTIFISQPNAITVKGHQELELRLEVLRLLVEYHNMVQWCLIEGLLPEIKEGSTQLPGLFAYPYSDLCRATNKRRAEFKALKGVVANHSMLLIDGLVKCAGPQLSSVWQINGKDDLYPPTSMQAVMNLFLLEDILLEVKQAIMLYFLQDLAAVLGCDDEDRQNVVVSFVRSFGIMPSLVHTIHGLWCIDHRDYEEGLRQLVNPNVQPHVWSPWMDVSVINTLLAQGQEATAARYMCSGHGIGATLEEQRLNIAVLVRNRKVSAAVDYMRRRCYHKKDPSDLMPFMLKECQNNKMIGQLLQLHLLQVEELEVEKYLRERSEPQALEPLLLYYLTHSRFVEAFTLNEEMNKLDKLEATCPAAREKAANRNRLMEAYLRVLPDITRKVLMEKQHRPNPIVAKRVEVIKPKPLSTMVYKKEPHILSRSHLIMAVMDKVEEAMNAVEDYEQEGGEPLTAIDSEDKNQSVYMATPLTPRHKSFVSLAETPEELIAYPEEMPASSLPTNPLSAAKRRLEERWGMEENLEENSLGALTKECLDLLKTPLKGSRSEISPRPTLTAVTMKTPQSILKVRRLSKSLLRPESRKTPDSGKRPKKLGFSASDSAIGSPSSPSLDIISITAATPKQLRFAGLSPTPSPSPLPVHSKHSPFGTDTSQSFVSEEESQEIPDSEAEEKMEVERVVDVTEEKMEGTEGEDITRESLVDTNENGVSESVVEVAQTDSEECMESIQSPDEEVAPVDTTQQTVDTTQQTVDITQQTVDTTQQTVDITQQTVLGSLDVSEEMTIKSLEEGSDDRYDEDLGKLVRPDLQSPWKHNQSSEEVVEVEENNATLHLTHIEGEPLTPAMTSSPLEESPEKQDDKKTNTVVPVKSVVAVEEDENVKKVVHSEKKESNTIRELNRNVLLSLVAPRQPETESNLSSIGLISHTRLSGISSLNVETSIATAVLERSLRSKSEISPEKSIAQPDSPPATPPLSKRAKMITKGTRKSTFNLVTPRRELRSTRSSERHLKANISTRLVSVETEVEKIEEEETENVSKMEKSPARPSKRKAVDEDTEDNEVAQEESLSVSTRSRKTPVRKSPSRSTKKKADEHKDDEDDKKENDIDEGDKTMEDNAMDQSSLRQTSVRRSPARSSKRKAAEVENDNDEAGSEHNMSMRTRLRSKTPERKSPARSIMKNTGDLNALQVVEESHDQQEEVKDNLPMGKGNDDIETEVESSSVEENRNMRQRKTPERKSPSRSVKARNHLQVVEESHIQTMNQEVKDDLPEANANEEIEVESGSSEENKSIRLKTPERKSPSRSVRTRRTESDASQKDKDAEESDMETGVSSRTRASPARNTRSSKTPERKTPSRKSKMHEKQTIEVLTEEVELTGTQTELHAQENDKDDEFVSSEEFLSKLDEEKEIAPPSPSARRRSTRLNTPERGVNSSHAPEPSRRSSRGRTTSISSTVADPSESELLVDKKTVHHVTRSKTPDREEEDQSVRRSRRLSRTPERFRTEIDEAIPTHPKVQRSPTRKLTPERGRRSPSRSIASNETKESEATTEPSKPKRDLTDALVESALHAVKGDSDVVTQEGTWSEELPPLRLEAEEEVGTKQKDEEEKPDIVFKQMVIVPHSQTVLSSPFVFSDPMTHTDDLSPIEGQDKVENPSHGFVFSHPTVPEDDIVDTKQETPKVEATDKTIKTKSKRQRRNLIDSPDLLPITDAGWTEQTKKERSRVRMSDIQRASANVMRRYSIRSGPVTRRLVPRSHKSDQQD